MIIAHLISYIDGEDKAAKDIDGAETAFLDA